jgi:sugar phosphate isomerase/epimerase
MLGDRLVERHANTAGNGEEHSMAANGQCAIVGVGETRYVRGSGVSTLHLGAECALNAIRDAGLTPADIDGMILFTYMDPLGTYEVAAALGIPYVLSSGPSPYVRRTFAERKRDMLFRREAEGYFATLREVAPIAERAGVTIVMKPHMGVTGTGADLADIVELIDHRAVRVCYDAGNVAFYEGVRPEDDVRDCARYVRAVCIKDHRGARANPDFPIPGEGDVDHAQVFRVLLQAGFAGPALVERLDGTQNAAEMPVETIDAALSRARANMERAAKEAVTG